MLIKKTAAGLAAGAALALFMSAGAAQAGVGAVTVTAFPNPSLAGETVTLNWSSYSYCQGSNVEFRDVTGGGSKLLCSATLDAAGAASCQTNLLTDTGARSIRGEATAGVCATASGNTAPQTVNAAPTPVPTTSEWTLWGLMGAMLIGGGVFASRRFRATAA